MRLLYIFGPLGHLGTRTVAAVIPAYRKAEPPSLTNAKQ